MSERIITKEGKEIFIIRQENGDIIRILPFPEDFYSVTIRETEAIFGVLGDGLKPQAQQKDTSGNKGQNQAS